MNWLHAIILGIVEGITEFLPVSSTGHLRIVEKLLGYDIQGAGITAFTAIIQVGAIIAAILYFWSDIVRIVVDGARVWPTKKTVTTRTTPSAGESSWARFR